MLFEKTQINLFFCSLIRTFHQLVKVLAFEKPKINLVFCSLIRTFAGRKQCHGLPLVSWEGARGKSGQQRTLHW